MVATSQPLASQAGLEMMRQGGNAMDAALAAAMTLIVVEPTGNGLGSDAFCIVSDGKDLHALNASGRSPKSWTPERFHGLDAMPQRGWDSVTIPGAVAAWVDLSARFGKLPFAKLFEPAIRYAEQGYCVSPVVAEVWRRAAAELKEQPGYAAAFMPEGRAPRAGELFRNRDIARSLRLIADTNGEAFYRGELAERIEAFAKKYGAAVTADDLALHRNDWCGTLKQEFGKSALHEVPPNGQGIAALLALGIVRHLGIEDCRVDSADALHLQIEAMKLAFADVERYVGDLDYMKAVTPTDLLSPAYLAERAKIVDRSKAKVFGAGAPKRGGTVCLATADESGMMVSYIQSNFSGFGSGVVVPETGISLQNRGSGFSLKAGHPNEVGGAKRPFHTIIPGFMTRDGKPHTAFGVMGGPIQAQGHLQAFLRMQLWGQDPQLTAEAPRWRFIDGVKVAIEPEADSGVVAELRSRGHDISSEAPEANFGFGGAQIVAATAEGFIGGSDPRKDGQVAGY